MHYFAVSRPACAVLTLACAAALGACHRQATPYAAASIAPPLLQAVPAATTAAQGEPYAAPAPASASVGGSPLVTRLEKPAKSVGEQEATVRFVTARACLVDFAGLHTLFQPGSLDSLMSRAKKKQVAKIKLPPGNIDVVAVGTTDDRGISKPVARALWRQYRPTFLVPTGGRSRLEQLGVPRSHIIEHEALVTGSAGTAGYSATLIPSHMPQSQHSYKKPPGAAGYVLSTKDRTLYFAGESAFGRQFEEVRNKFGAPDVSILNVVAGADSEVARQQKKTLSLIEAAHAQAILYSPVAVSLPHKETVSHVSAIAPVAGSDAACFVTPQGAEVLHIALGRRGALRGRARGGEPAGADRANELQHAGPRRRAAHPRPAAGRADAGRRAACLPARAPAHARGHTEAAGHASGAGPRRAIARVSPFLLPALKSCRTVASGTAESLWLVPNTAQSRLSMFHDQLQIGSQGQVQVGVEVCMEAVENRSGQTREMAQIQWRRPASPPPVQYAMQGDSASADAVQNFAPQAAPIPSAPSTASALVAPFAAQPPLLPAQVGSLPECELFEDSLFWRNLVERSRSEAQAARADTVREHQEVTDLGLKLEQLQETVHALQAALAPPAKGAQLLEIRLTDGVGTIQRALLAQAKGSLLSILDDHQQAPRDNEGRPSLPCSLATWNQVVPWFSSGEVPRDAASDLLGLAKHWGEDPLVDCLEAYTDDFTTFSCGPDSLSGRIQIVDWYERSHGAASIMLALPFPMGGFACKISAWGFSLEQVAAVSGDGGPGLKINFSLSVIGRDNQILLGNLHGAHKEQSTQTKFFALRPCYVEQVRSSPAWGFAWKKGVGIDALRLRNRPQAWSSGRLRINLTMKLVSKHTI